MSTNKRIAGRKRAPAQDLAGHAGVTQRQIAQALGLTQMTVSRALNGSEHMAAETRERILAKASELGYRPNGLARRVQERRYRGMALLGSIAPGCRNIDEPEFHLAVGLTLSARKWHLTQAWLPDAGLGDPQVVRDLLERTLADAVLIHDVGPQQPAAEELLRQHHIPCVWVNSGRAWNGVDFDDRQAARDGTIHLHGRGRRRPALAIPHLPEAEDHVSLHQRVRGYLDACRDLGLTPRLLHPPTRYDYQQMPDVLGRALDGAERPDAILCYTPDLALQLRILAAERGWRVGTDLGVVVIGSSSRSILDQPYTSVGLDYEALGREAAAMAWRLLETGKRQPQVLIPPTILRPDATS